MIIKINKNILVYYLLIILGIFISFMILYSRLKYRFPKNLNYEINYIFFLIALFSLVITLMILKNLIINKKDSFLSK